MGGPRLPVFTSLCVCVCVFDGCVCFVLFYSFVVRFVFCLLVSICLFGCLLVSFFVSFCSIFLVFCLYTVN